MSDMIRWGGLWKGKTKAGKFYLSGRFGGVKMLVFPVDEKRTEKSPDFTVYFAQWEDPEQVSQEENRAPQASDDPWGGECGCA